MQQSHHTPLRTNDLSGSRKIFLSAIYLASCWFAFPSISQPLLPGLEDLHLRMPLKQLLESRPKVTALLRRLDPTKTNQTVYEFRAGQDPTGKVILDKTNTANLLPQGSFFSYIIREGVLAQIKVAVTGDQELVRDYQSTVVESCMKDLGTNYCTYFRRLAPADEEVVPMGPAVVWRSENCVVEIVRLDVTRYSKQEKLKGIVLFISISDRTLAPEAKKQPAIEVPPQDAELLLLELHPKLESRTFR